MVGDWSFNKDKCTWSDTCPLSPSPTPSPTPPPRTPSCFHGLPSVCANATECTNPGSQTVDGYCPNEASTGEKCCVENYSNYSLGVQYFIDIEDSNAFNQIKAEAKEWFQEFLWPLVLEEVNDLITEPLDFDDFFDGFTDAFFTDLTNIIDKDALYRIAEELIPDDDPFEENRELSAVEEKFIQATHDMEEIISRHRDLFLTEDECVAKIIEIVIDVLALGISVFQIPIGGAKTIVRSFMTNPALGPAFTMAVRSVKVFDKKFIVDLFVVLFANVSFHDISGAFKKTLKDFSIGALIAIIVEWSAIYLSAGVYAVVKWANIAISAIQLVKDGYELYSECFADSCPLLSGSRLLAEEDSIPEICSGVVPDSCTLYSVECQGESAELVCKTSEISCPSGFICDPVDSQCKLIDALVPCVAVIDEDDSFGGGQQQEILWSEFRGNYPDRPFCLLIPADGSGMSIPENFSSDGLTITHFDITRDNGDVSKAENWTSLCGLSEFFSAGIGVDFVGLFIDDSGSMRETEVLASRDLFYSSIELEGATIKKVVNGNENWIEPFLTTLAPEVPERACLTPSGQSGTCISTAECASKGFFSVPYFPGDASPNCKDFPADVQCCVTEPEPCKTRDGSDGKCLPLAECTEDPVAYQSGDPQPNCQRFPTNIQCCV